MVEQDTSHQHSTVEPFFFTQRLPPPPEVRKLQVQALDCCICLHCYQRCCAYLALVFPNVFEFRSVIIYFSTDGPPRAGAMAWPSCLRPRPDPLLNGEAAVPGTEQSPCRCGEPGPQTGAHDHPAPRPATRSPCRVEDGCPVKTARSTSASARLLPDRK